MHLRFGPMEILRLLRVVGVCCAGLQIIIIQMMVGLVQRCGVAGGMMEFGIFQRSRHHFVRVLRRHAGLTSGVGEYV